MEEEILQFLECNEGTRYTCKLVGKIVDRDRFREDTEWARPPLEVLVRQRKIVSDADGFFFEFTSQPAARR